MCFLKKNIWLLRLLVLAVVCLMAPDAFADNGFADGDFGDKNVFYVARLKSGQVFQAVKSVIFIVGGFGLVGLAFAAIFGKLNWKWFAALSVGLAMLAAAGSIIRYAISDNGDRGINSSYFNDSLRGPSGW